MSSPLSKALEAADTAAPSDAISAPLPLNIYVPIAYHFRITRTFCRACGCHTDVGTWYAECKWRKHLDGRPFSRLIPVSTLDWNVPTHVHREPILDTVSSCVDCMWTPHGYTTPDLSTKPRPISTTEPVLHCYDAALAEAVTAKTRGTSDTVVKGFVPRAVYEARKARELAGLPEPKNPRAKPAASQTPSTPRLRPGSQTTDVLEF